MSERTGKGRFTLGCTFTLTLAFVSTTWAQESSTGIAADRFAPGIGPVTLFAGEGAATTQAGRARVALSIGYLRDPIRLINRFTGAPFSRPVVGQMVIDAGAELGIWRGLAFAFGVPLVVHNEGDRLRGLGDDRALAGPAAGDLRLRLKYAFVSDPARRFHLGGLLLVTVPLGGQSDFAATGSATVEPRLVADLRVWRFLFIANLGVRFAGEQRLGQTLFSDQITWLVGTSADLGGRGEFRVLALLEFAGAAGFTEGTRPAELRAGLRGAVDTRFSLDLGAGAGLVEEAGTPTWRVFGVVRIALEPAPQ
jgi:hypothetical protein